MRIAVISDLHGNLVAFEAVVADLAGRFDQIVCLGDVAALGPQPCDTIARLRELNCPVVMGNTDAWLLDPATAPQSDAAMRRIMETELWSAGQLGDRDRAFLSSFQPTIEVALGDGEALLAYHGSPRSFHDLIEAATPEAELQPFFADARAEVMAGGHTHVQMLRRWEGVTLINPGSVGSPVESGTPARPLRRHVRAEYAIVTWQAGALSLEFRRVPFDARAVAEAIRASGMPHADYWANQWDV